jgi:hypothetical protein
MKLSKAILAVVATGLLSCGLFGQQAQANTMQLTLDYGSRHFGDGGEFDASSPDFAPATMGYKSATTYNGGFETFCVQTNEYFNPGSTYYYGISQGSISGGSFNPLTRGAAWLYLNFAHGSLFGYNYSFGGLGSASAGALQSEIWFLQGQGANPHNAFSTLVTNNVTNYMAPNNGYYGVAVLNLWGDINHTQVVQNQLILVPSRVPDSGSTVMLLGTALSVLGMARRYLKS